MWCPAPRWGGSWRALIVLALLLPASISEARDRYVIPRLGTLELSVPAKWQVKFVYQEDLSDYPRWFLAPMDERLQLFMTIMWPVQGQAHAMPGIRDLLERIGRQALSFSDQDQLRIIELSAGHRPIYYYDLSDRGAQPPEYKYLRQGVVDLGDYVLVFTLLQNQAGSVDGEQVMAMLEGLRFQVFPGI